MVGDPNSPSSMAGSVLEVRDHAVPIDGSRESGWGRLSIPSDASPADNEFFFVYDKEVERRTLIVSDQAEAVRPIEFAAGVSPEPDFKCSVEMLAPDQLIGDELDECRTAGLAGADSGANGSQRLPA